MVKSTKETVSLSKELRILFIDDDETMSKILASGISQHNADWKVSIINSMDDLEFSSIQNFDLIILDLLMPGVDGIECLRQFSHEGVHTPIILVSGLDCRMLSSARNVGTNYGLDIIGVFRKPIPWEEFLQLITGLNARQKKSSAALPNLKISKHEIEAALRGDQFVLYYQPQISFKDLSLDGLEALIRWNHPTHGLLGPGFFLPAVESFGFAEQLTLWVINRALQDMQRLEELFGFEGEMSVNVPPLILNDYRLADKIIDLVAHSSVDPGRLQLEITESSLESNFVASLDVQTRLAMRGLHLSIDDFGTGFSSLARLSDSYFDELKIDRFFIKKALFSQKDQAILINMINMGHQMNMTIVGEGIEDRETFMWLKQHNCDVAQGFLFSAPLPIDELKNWVETELPRLAEKLA